MAEKTTKDVSYEARLLANRMWYQDPKNREWKKNYNKNYYLTNLSKWSNYRRISKERSRNANDKYSTWSKVASESRKKFPYLGEASGFYDASVERSKAFKDAREAKIRDEAVKLARQHAKQDYDFYMETHKKMSVREAWSDGASQIRNVGKKFMNKFYDKLLGNEYTR